MEEQEVFKVDDGTRNFENQKCIDLMLKILAARH